MGHERHETQMIPLRALQIIIFLISYVSASTVADMDDWKTRFDTTLLHSSLFAILYMALVSVLPSQVPIFLAMMAMPPMVDAVNLDFFYAVIEEQLKTLPAEPLINTAAPREFRQSVLSSVSAASQHLSNVGSDRTSDDTFQELTRHRTIIKNLARRVSALELDLEKEHGIIAAKTETESIAKILDQGSTVLPTVSPEIVGNPGPHALHVPGGLAEDDTA